MTPFQGCEEVTIVEQKAAKDRMPCVQLDSITLLHIASFSRLPKPSLKIEARTTKFVILIGSSAQVSPSMQCRPFQFGVAVARTENSPGSRTVMIKGTGGASWDKSLTRLAFVALGVRPQMPVQHNKASHNNNVVFRRFDRSSERVISGLWSMGSIPVMDKIHTVPYGCDVVISLIPFGKCARSSLPFPIKLPSIEQGSDSILWPKSFKPTNAFH